ncbi:hypothetical protein Tco_1428394 [Tanacetum coccineum]
MGGGGGEVDGSEDGRGGDGVGVVRGVIWGERNGGRGGREVEIVWGGWRQEMGVVVVVGGEGGGGERSLGGGVVGWGFVRIMSITKEQQQALDDALVPQEQRLRIGNCNYRLSTTFKPKEPTFQVALDVLSLTPFYQAFLISASVPAIYMHEFWATVSYHKHCIKFKLNKKNHSFNLETFKDMLQICPNLPG